MPRLRFGTCLICCCPLDTASEADYLLCGWCARHLDDFEEPDPEREAEAARELAEERAWEREQRRRAADRARIEARRLARHTATVAPRRPDVVIVRPAAPVLVKRGAR